MGAAVLALPGPAREALASVLERYGARHPTGTLTVPAGCVEVEVRYTTRTPTNGLLREAAAIGIPNLYRQHADIALRRRDDDHVHRT